MKKIQSMLVFNSIVYWSVYLIKSFVIWKFTNPFQWIVDIPTNTNDERLGIFSTILLVIIVETAVASIFLDKNGKLNS